MLTANWLNRQQEADTKEVEDTKDRVQEWLNKKQ
jgi:hypothetical protein